MLGEDAPKDYGPGKRICNRFIRWSRLGVLDKIFAAFAASLLKKGLFLDVWGAPMAAVDQG